MIKSTLTDRVTIADDRVYIDGKDVTENPPERFCSNDRNSNKLNLGKVVCQMVNGEPTGETGKRVRYIDGDKKNIRPSNLVWQKHKFGDESRHKKPRKLSEQQINEIIDLLNNCELYEDIAKRFDVDSQFISTINTGKVYADITKIDRSRIFSKGRNIRTLPNGKYAVVITSPIKFFETYEEAKKEVAKHFHGESYAK